MIEQINKILDYNPETGIFTWKVTRGRAKIGSVAGNITTQGYVEIRINRISYKAHRLAWLMTYNEFPKVGIDHINGIRNDNQISNLRIATKRENGQNLHIHRNGRLVGTSYYKSTGRWRANVSAKGRVIHLGYFSTEELAHAAYQNYLTQKGLK
jgi:hypothetical protein